jgi:hypothetical protein
MVFVQYNLRLSRNQLMNKTPESSNIFLDDVDPSSDWVVETQPATFDHEDLSWMDLDPEPHQENVCTNVAPVSLPAPMLHLYLCLLDQGNQARLRIPLFSLLMLLRM